MFNSLFTDEFLCSDGTTVIKQTQLCDDVPDCPLRNATQNLWYGRSHQHSKIAEDEGDKCPGKIYTDCKFLNIN